MTKRWTKKAAIKRMEQDQRLQHILELEPRLKPIIEAATAQRKHKAYDRIETYVELRNQAMHLVGALAQNPKLKGHQYYEVVIRTIDDLLPPDEEDLAD